MLSYSYCYDSVHCIVARAVGKRGEIFLFILGLLVIFLAYKLISHYFSLKNSESLNQQLVR